MASSVKGTTPIALDEQRIKNYLDEEILKDEGIVKGYNFVGWTINEVFTQTAAEGQYEEMWVGFGMKNIEFYGVNIYGI